MTAPNPETRLNVALKQAEYAKGILTELVEELWEAGDTGRTEPETAFFLIDELQSTLSRTRSHVAVYFDSKESDEGAQGGGESSVAYWNRGDS